MTKVTTVQHQTQSHGKKKHNKEQRYKTMARNSPDQTGAETVKKNKSKRKSKLQSTTLPTEQPRNSSPES
jgi:hypothetical protein